MEGALIEWGAKLSEKSGVLRKGSVEKE